MKYEITENIVAQQKHNIHIVMQDWLSDSLYDQTARM
jgi:hypothetical protein